MAILFFAGYWKFIRLKGVSGLTSVKQKAIMSETVINVDLIISNSKVKTEKPARIAYKIETSPNIVDDLRGSFADKGRGMVR